MVPVALLCTEIDELDVVGKHRVLILRSLHTLYVVLALLEFRFTVVARVHYSNGDQIIHNNPSIAWSVIPGG